MNFHVDKMKKEITRNSVHGIFVIEIYIVSNSKHSSGDKCAAGKLIKDTWRGYI